MQHHARRDVWRKKLCESKALRVACRPLASSLLEQPQVRGPVANRLVLVVDVGCRSEICDQWQKLLEDEDLVLIDRERDLTPHLEAVVPSDVLERAGLMGVVGHKRAEEGPELPRNLLGLDRTLVAHR